MAEFKFSCPHCGQHIECDAGYSGAQINCPSCQQAIVVPQAPPSAAAPPAYAAPPPPPVPSQTLLATRQSTGVAGTGQRFAGADAPPPRKKFGALKIAVSVAAFLVFATIGFFGVTYALKHVGVGGKSKGNPAAQVTVPTANAAVQALSILSKVRSAYTNLATATVEGTFTMYLDVSNITMADVDPDRAATAKNGNRRPPGMPRVITNRSELTFKGGRTMTNWYYFAAESVSKIDRMTISNTFASWSSGNGRFTFSDSHVKGMPHLHTTSRRHSGRRSIGAIQANAAAI